MISEVLMPGNWTLVLNRTETLESWTLKKESTTLLTDGKQLMGSRNRDIDKSVLIGGKIFWDLNEDDLPSSGEGIVDVNVHYSDSGFDETVATDSEGV